MFSAAQFAIFQLLLLGFIFSCAGITLAYFNCRLAEIFGRIVLAASAGAIFSIVVFHMLPSAFETSHGGWALVGLFFSLWIGKLLPKLTGNGRIEGMLPALALGLHSMTDGAMYEISVTSRGVEEGMLSMFGLAVHEFPEGVAAYFLLQTAGLGQKRAFWAAIALVGISAPIGAALLYPLMEVFDQDGLNAMFGFVSGLVLTVVLYLLWVVARTMPPIVSLPALAAGSGTAILFLLVHNH